MRAKLFQSLPHREKEETDMYGTIGHLRVKAGMEEPFLQLLQAQAEAFEGGQITGRELRVSFGSQTERICDGGTL